MAKVGDSFYVRYENVDSKSNGKTFFVREEDNEFHHYLIDTGESYVGGGRLLKKYCVKVNKVIELFVAISNEELKQAIIEIREASVSGFYKEDGLIRKYSKLSSEVTGVTCDHFITTINLVKEAAFRWAD